MGKTQGLHDGHRDRVRNRFLAEGLDTFEQHNALELLLYYCVTRIDTNELAHTLINEFGSFSGVLDAPHDQLVKFSGITSNGALLLNLIPQLARMYMMDCGREDTIMDSSQKLGDHFIKRFVGRTQECVYAMFLDSSNAVIATSILTQGTVTRANISVRKLVNLAVRYNACSVVLAHNHPRGLAALSNDDVVMTRYLYDVLKPMDVTLLDHIVVARNSYVSLAEIGYLKDKC